MGAVGATTPGSALSDFCDGVLRIITDPPGREYDKQKLNHSIMNAVTPLVSTTAAATASAIITKLTPQLKVIDALVKDKTEPPPLRHHKPRARALTITSVMPRKANTRAPQRTNVVPQPIGLLTF
jgi:hypothetical protein